MVYSQYHYCNSDSFGILANMATIAGYINKFINEKADKRVSEWLLMSSLWPTLGISIVYLFLVYGILPAYMKNQKPYNLINIIRIYNLLQIVSCSWLIYWILTSGWVQRDFDLSCQPIDYSNSPLALSMLQAFHWTYFLKMMECLETIFFLLRKKTKQVTNLHVYHHASSLMLAWIGCKFVGGGMASLPIMVNCFVHILMYLYYYLSSFGPIWQKKLSLWKPRLTIIQMVQFTILIIHALIVLRPSCETPRKALILLYLPNVVLIFKMFYDFYKASYMQKKHQ